MIATTDPWMAAMRSGDFATAWGISDSVLERRRGQPSHHLPRHEQYLWTGEDLRGKRVLVRCYHGLGDTVQFVRFMPQLKALARDVVVWAQPALVPLLATCTGIDELLPLHDGVPDVAYDADIEIMEVPHVLRTTLATLPRDIPYLWPPRPSPMSNAQPAAGKAAFPAGQSGRRVGLVWQSGGWDDRRSMPTELLRPLLEVPDVEFCALQVGDVVREWRAEWGRVDSTTDVRELTTKLVSLDLLITVDSFPAHLAGALGVPTWTLLHSDPDWRWMEGREDSPWYPTMRLFRQQAAGDWAGLMARVAEELRNPARLRAVG